MQSSILAKRENQSIYESYGYVKEKKSIYIPDEWLVSLQEHLNDDSEWVGSGRVTSFMCKNREKM